MVEGTIPVQVNFFGPNLNSNDVRVILDPRLDDHMKSTNIALLEGFFDLPVLALNSEILKRYLKASKYTYLAFIPHSDKIYKKLINPLRIAKKAYCLGDYLAVISSCGVVCEMLALFIWNFGNIQLNNRKLNVEDEIKLFGKAFEKLSQNRRVEILKSLGRINTEQFSEFNDIRARRNPYLHLWSKEILNEESDAFQTMKKTFNLFDQIIGLRWSKDGLRMSPELKKLYQSEKV